MSKLIITDVAIRQDSQNRYCLNDLHKAAGNENKHRPSLWLKNKQSIELANEIAKAGIPALRENKPVNVIKGGNQSGTYVVKELVYSYAMWINAAFQIKVIRAYDALVTGEIPEHIVKAYDELVSNKIPEYLKVISAPMSVLEFEERYAFHKNALENLKNVQTTLSAKDFLSLKANKNG